MVLQASTEDEAQVERQFSVQPEDDSVVIDIRSNQQDSDDDEEQENAKIIKQQQEKMHTIEKARSVSESSGDELASSNGSVRSSKGILKSRRIRDFSRSMSESSADENSFPASCTDYHYDFTHDVNSESDCSSFKKTVRFNDVVSRQLYRYYNTEKSIIQNIYFMKFSEIPFISRKIREFFKNFIGIQGI